MIYLGLITGRVPIVNVFNPSHLLSYHPDAGSIAFDEVFDLDTLSENIGLPVLQWHEVKDVDSEEVEDIGCWNICEYCDARCLCQLLICTLITGEAVQNEEHYPRVIYTLQDQGLGA